MPRTSTASPPRCRHCGASLVGGKRGRACPRCHPEEAALAAQLELSFFSPPPDDSAIPVPADSARPPLSRRARIESPANAIPQKIATAENDADPPAAGPDAAPPIENKVAHSHAPASIPSKPRTSVGHYFSIAAGSLIVIGGLSWAGFQMWPRGPVERSIVQAIEALPHFVERTGAQNPFDSIAVDGDSSPAFVELNGDGLLDLVTGSRSGEIRVFRNTGTRKQPRFLQAAGDAFGLVTTDTSNAVAFADLRGAQLPDALNAGTNGAFTFFQNRGAARRPSFVLLAPEDDPFAVTVAPAHSYDWRATFADLDHDGDLDLLVGTRDGSILYFENRGTPQKPQFQGVTRVDPFGLRGLGELVSLTFGDLDGDGDLDAIAANAAGELLFLENRGNAWRSKFVLMARGTLGLGNAGPDATVALVDLDDDGDLDLVIGGADGHFRYFENLSTPAPGR